MVIFFWEGWSPVDSQRLGWACSALQKLRLFLIIQRHVRGPVTMMDDNAFPEMSFCSRHATRMQGSNQQFRAYEFHKEDMQTPQSFSADTFAKRLLMKTKTLLE